jgi:hypothetical protein
VAGVGRPKPTLLQLADERPPELAAASWLQSVPTLPARGPMALDEEEVADTEFMTPNVRAKRATAAGRQARAVQHGQRRRAGLVACRWRSA